MRVVIFILFVILLSFNVNALAVASDYLKNDTMILEDDESKIYGIRLQNTGLGEIYLKVTYDDTVAKIIDYQEFYTVSPESSYEILFNISPPKKSRPNEVFTVSYTVHELGGKGGSLPILLKINKNFNVRIIKNPEKIYLEDYSYVTYSVIALVFLLYVFRKNIMRFWKRKHKTPKTYLKWKIK